ncbi:hypothetical protein PHLCEN_2v1240 [Hermanssonia centrifuga]|uniref:Uncharacterized protein n=1 Tax=Hermanssonia centrifuga TaxID=98765 RepID=A0A2R6S3S9_9APHY|nr:hypothetical protein PHLCEN_2v1240 [Hermanssonia centrifuga]
MAFGVRSLSLAAIVVSMVIGMVGAIPSASSRDVVSFNPVGIKLNPLDDLLAPLTARGMSNAQRLARGLPPNKPRFRRTDKQLGARTSPTPTTSVPSSSPTPACSPTTGALRAVSTDADMPLDGYVNASPNPYGEFGYTTDQVAAMIVTVSPCGNGSPINVVSSNSVKSMPYLGGIEGFADDSPDLEPREFNYMVLGGVTQTSPHATPQNGANSYTAATGNSKYIESAIWTIDDAGVLSAQWVNTNGSLPATILVYVPSADSFALIGDVDAFEETFYQAPISTFSVVPV